MLLDVNSSVKLADFAGSSIDGSPATVNYEVRSRLPGMLAPSKQSDIFALGCAIYEMATGVRPYEEKAYKVVQQLYAKKTFPDTADIEGLGGIIWNCWWQRFDNVGEIVRDLGALQRGTPKHSRKPEAVIMNSQTPTTPSPIASSTEPPQAARVDRASPPAHVHSPSPQHRSAADCEAEREVVEIRKGHRRKSHRKKYVKESEDSWLNKFMSWTRLAPREGARTCKYNC
jgi:serine/threonine protein kinase